jgi:hypothetical protein
MSLSQEQKDIIEIKHEVGRLRSHFEVYKTDVSDVRDGIKEIKILLGGTALNGHKGFIKLMEAVEEKVDKIDKENELIKKDLDSIKFWGRGASGVAFVTLGLVVKKLFSL